MGCYLGDFKKGSSVYFCWGMNGGNGGSIERDNVEERGTIAVYRADMTGKLEAGEEGCGLTEYTSMDGMASINSGTIDLSANEFYEAGMDYYIVLKGVVIEGVTVNAVLGTFSIENRLAGSELFQRAAKMLVNKAVQDKESGAVEYYDDDGENVCLSHHLTEDENSIVRMPG